MNRGEHVRSRSSRRFFTLFLAVLMVLPACADADDPRGDWYVSPGGNDEWSGELAEPNSTGTDGPFATLERAKRAARERIAEGLNSSIKTLVREGTYYLPNGFALGPEDSGTAEYSVTYSAYPDEKVVLIGGMPVEDWKPADKAGVWRAKIPDGVQPKQLFENGRRLTLARTPNAGYFQIIGPVPGKTREAFYYDPQDIDPSVWDYSHGSVFIWPGHNWFSYTKPIVGIATEQNMITMGTPHGYDMRPGDRYFVQNIPQLLDLPGECVIDIATRTILCKPFEQPIQEQRMIISTAQNVIAVEGKGVKQLVRNIRIRDFTITTANGDAVRIADADACQVGACSIENAGGRGVVLSGNVRHTSVVASRIAFHGSHGVDISGPGLGGGPGSSHNYVTNNQIHHCGRLVGHGYGLHIAQSGHNTVNFNHIHHMPRYGVSIKGTCFTGNARLVEGATFEARVAKALIHSRNNWIWNNHIHHVNLDSQDTGGIEAWGPGIGNVIDNNIIHDVGNPHFDLISGIYLDDAADYFTVTDNIIWGIHGTRGNQCIYTKGIGNIIENNVLVCSPDNVRGIRSFEMANELARAHHYNRNIFVFEGNERVVYQFDNWSGDRVASSDCNLIWMKDGKPSIAGGPADASWEVWRSLMGGKFDQNSVVADPLFVDPENHDYHLGPQSPACDIGIRSISTRMVGLSREFFPEEPGLASRLDVIEEISTAPYAGPGRVRLTVENVSSVPWSGEVLLELYPPEAGRILVNPKVSLTLEAKEESKVDFEVGASREARKMLIVAVPRDKWTEPAYLPVKLRRHIEIPRVGKALGLDDVTDKLRSLPGHDAASPLRLLGSLRFAVCGGNLALSAEVKDTNIAHAENPWEASCIELFVSPSGKKDIIQLFLLPGKEGLPSIVRRGMAEGQPVAEEVELRTGSTDGGYQLGALIPLETLGLTEETQRFFLEASVIAWPEGARSYQRGMLFGGPSAFNDTSGYAEVRVR